MNQQLQIVKIKSKNKITCFFLLMFASQIEIFSFFSFLLELESLKVFFSMLRYGTNFSLFLNFHF